MLDVYYKQKRKANGYLEGSFKKEYQRYSISFHSLTRSEDKSIIHATKNLGS